MTLSDVEVVTAKPKKRPYKLADGHGLFLLVNPHGGKWWRFRYRFEGKEKLLSLGTFPKISLAQARSLRDNARQLLKQGQDPSAARKAEKVEQKEIEKLTTPAVRFLMDGTVELWKGLSVIHLTRDEARFIAIQLSTLARCPNGTD